MATRASTTTAASSASVPEKPAGTAPSQRRWRTFGIAFVLFLAPMLLWALASPLGSVPDEPSHAIRAAQVVRGQFETGEWSVNPMLSYATVPAYVAFMHERTCYATHPKLTPACEPTLTGNPDRLVTTGTSADANSPVYYAVVGLPTLVLDGDAALFGMRFVSALLCAAALAAMVMQLSALRRSRWAIAGAVVGLTPMVLFLAGSINPNAIEAASAGALFATLVAIVRAPSAGRVLVERVIISLIAVALLVNTRSISLLWLLLIVVAAVALSKRAELFALLKRPIVLVLVIGSAVLALLSVAWILGAPHDASPVTGTNPLPNFTAAFLYMVENTFDFASGYIGYFGWVDTPSPSFSTVVWTVAIVGFVLVALVWGSGRSRWVTGGFALALLLVPPITQGVLAPSLGLIWQGRYMLAVLVCLLVASGMALDESFETVPLVGRARAALILAIVLLAATQVVSFVWVLRRYVVGVSQHSSLGMITSPAWQPPLTWEVLTVLLVVWSVVASVVVYRRLARGAADRPALVSA